ncbi:MAG: glycosyl transferase family 36 [Hyphomicrobiales bacterium]|nr:glycosyl transferase family 36 [Hyphomicrobiales bacterium]
MVSGVQKPDVGGLRLVAGVALACAAVWLAGAGGWMHAGAGALAGALALALIAPAPGPLIAPFAIFDALVLAAYGLLCNPAGVLWRAPGAWSEVFAFTSLGASVAAGLYIATIAIAFASSARRPHFAPSIALALTPFAFCLFIAMGSNLPEQIGRIAPIVGLFPQPYDRAIASAIGHALILIALNEAVIASAAVALGRKIPNERGLHVWLIGAAILAAFTPVFAEFGSSAFVASLPRALSVVCAAAMAAAAQAGVWGETYLVTQAVVDLLHGAPPIKQSVKKPWRSGFGKGAVYGLVFMGLIGVADLVVNQRWLMQALAPTHDMLAPFFAALAGAIVYPLARTILESTDSTPPFFGRLRAEALRPSNYFRGLAFGAAILIGAREGAPGWSGGWRFLFGAAAGAAMYAGVDALSDLALILSGSRKRMSSWRLYVFGALLGGFVGGAIAWYFDVGQIEVVRAKLIRYMTISFAAAGQPVSDYNIFPLFSKWGVTNLGATTGGVKLFYLESVSGVIQWIFAAPLFSINLFFLTALVKRSLNPLRGLFSANGVRALVDNAILVLRWGLWMAPVIYTFLKAAPTPEWYNQDGLVRTGVATLYSATHTPQQFAAWSLDVFTALLAFDWLRVLIWFDHMGLRVATLVNLSFVGGDAVDEKAARFIGKQQVSRAIPEGLRRFGTWAPLLLPFYIPRGADWDKAWSGAERLSQAAPPVSDLLLGYTLVAAAAAVAFASILLQRLAGSQRALAHRGTGAGGDYGSRPHVLTNGLVTSEWFDDGQNVSRVESAARSGAPIDITRRPDDPLQPRGKFVYFREGDGSLWSLGAAPTHAGGALETRRLSPTQLFIAHTHNGLRAEAIIETADGEPLEITRLKLVNLDQRPRVVTIATLREWVMNETGVERRDAAYNAIHVGTWFMAEPTAIIAQNRLLKTKGASATERRLSPEVGFHAAGHGATGDVRLVGYEDARSRFYGLGSARAPDSLVLPHGAPPRTAGDQGLLYSFEPCASLRFEARIAPGSTAEIILLDGWAANFNAAAATIARHLGAAAPQEDSLAAIEAKTRLLAPPPAPTEPRFAFTADGRALHVKPGAPRAFSHVIANPLSHGAVLTAEGDIFSFARNARQNSLTPFRLGEGRSGPPAQAIYVRHIASGDVDSPTYAPLRRADGEWDVEFGLGYVVYTRKRADLELQMTVFTPPGAPVETKILRILNKGDGDKLYSVAPVAEMVLAETPAESLNSLRFTRDRNGKAIYFRNPRNDFVKGWAFAATSLNADFAETSRARVVGGAVRANPAPYIAERGHPDTRLEPGMQKVAAFSGVVRAKAGEPIDVVFSLGQTETLADARRLAAQTADAGWARQQLAATRAFWDGVLSTLRIETNNPDFDRLVNDWLPYQLLAARLWGRTGPAQRSGATGYRDQLQDVLPLAFLAPDLARKQILLHARHQFVEGDAVKWWHTAPGGGTGLADRTHASDPHLWLPYVALRYAQATGDEAIFDENAPFIDDDPTPRGQEGRASVPVPSRESASLFEHCRRAIDWTLDRFGAHGLPLMGTGDWDDGMNLIGFSGRGESVWVGFFLHGILNDFAAVCDKRRDARQAERYRGRAQKLREALSHCWRGDRFLRAYADDGGEVSPVSAMTSSWPVLSGAVDHARGVEAVENALAVLERPDRVLLVHPAYDEHSRPFPGRSAEYPPGVRENGGQYSHGSSWFVDALTQLASEAQDPGEAARLYGRAYAVWSAISPLSKFSTAEAADAYGLPPHQQPADVYEGPGYDGRGGWAWYTGSAARMLSAAYGLLGLRLDKGAFSLRADAFEPKGGLQLRRVVYRGQVYDAPKS